MRDRVLLEIDKLPDDTKTYFEQLFQPSSYAFLKTSKIVTIKANIRFVSTGEVVDKIWICISGSVKVMEEFKTGETYIFTQFSAPEIYGEMETLADIPHYRSSLVAATDCIFIVGSVPAYVSWIKKDASALYERSRFLARRLMEEGRSNRAYLLLDGTERIKIYFTEYYANNQDEGVSVLRKTRQQISDETGYSVKTVSRVIKKLSDQALLTVEGQRIMMTNKQYKKMLDSMDEKAKYK